MTLSPESAALLAKLDGMGARPHSEVGVLRARANVEASRWMQIPKAEGVTIDDVLVDGATGHLPARVYRPTPTRHDSTTPAPAPTPTRYGDITPESGVGSARYGSITSESGGASARCGSITPDSGGVSGAAGAVVVWFHGGGWVTGSVAASDRACRAVCAGSGCVVVSVEYRLAPENPFPAPLEDCLAAIGWVSAHVGELGGDRVVVAGDSAGGNLAAGVALLARDRGGPEIARQVLVYPAVAPPDADAHPSYRANADGYSLTRADMDWFWGLYLAGQDVSPAAAPLFADDLAGLPPASIAVAGFDPLRDEGLAYAARLRDAGVDVTTREWPDTIHGFLWMGGELSATAELVSWIATECER